MCCALVYCLVVDLTISVLVSVGLLFHDVELDVGGKAAKGFPEQQCLGAEARRGGFVKWLPCYAEEQVCVDSGVYHEPRNVSSGFNTVFLSLLLLAAGVGFPAACFWR